MPIKSKAQRRKFAELLVDGKIDAETFERWNREAGGAELPERVRSRSSAKKRGTKKSRKSSSKKARSSSSKSRKRSTKTSTGRTAKTRKATRR